MRSEQTFDAAVSSCPSEIKGDDKWPSTLPTTDQPDTAAAAAAGLPSAPCWPCAGSSHGGGRASAAFAGPRPALRAFAGPAASKRAPQNWQYAMSGVFAPPQRPQVVFKACSCAREPRPRTGAPTSGAPPSSPPMTGGAAATPCGAATGAEWLALTGVPHDEQKRLPTGLLLPHFRQDTSSGPSLGEKSKSGAGGRERVGSSARQPVRD